MCTGHSFHDHLACHECPTVLLHKQREKGPTARPGKNDVYRPTRKLHQKYTFKVLGTARWSEAAPVWFWWRAWPLE